MLIVKKGLMAMAALGAATLMSGATPKNAAACEGDDCANLCQCLNNWCAPGDAACRQNCYWLFPDCGTNHLCP